MSTRRAVLIVNLGSPASTSLEDVREYLEEFLGDSRVIDRPRWRWLRRTIVNRLIIPRRLKNSAHAYSKIWTKDGSPLITTSRSVCEKLAAALRNVTEPTSQQANASPARPAEASGSVADEAVPEERDCIPVYLAMRYGQPSIPEIVAQIAAAGVKQVLLFPQYPHYAMSSWETVVVRVCEAFARRASEVRLDCVKPFYADADYIDALAAVCRPYLENRNQGGKSTTPSPHDHLLFSYHGIPVRHVDIASLRGVNVHFVEHPLAQWTPETGGLSYVAHIKQTTEKLLARLGDIAPLHSLAYQSRLVGEPWLSPYTDVELVRLPREEGVRRLFVLCPAFTTDCLETLEEIQMQGRDSFLGAGGDRCVSAGGGSCESRDGNKCGSLGGEAFTQIPCLNDHPAYIDFLAGRVRHWAAS